MSGIEKEVKEKVPTILIVLFCFSLIIFAVALSFFLLSRIKGDREKNTIDEVDCHYDWVCLTKQGEDAVTAAGGKVTICEADNNPDTIMYYNNNTNSSDHYVKYDTTADPTNINVYPTIDNNRPATGTIPFFPYVENYMLVNGSKNGLVTCNSKLINPGDSFTGDCAGLLDNDGKRNYTRTDVFDAAPL